MPNNEIKEKILCVQLIPYFFFQKFILSVCKIPHFSRSEGTDNELMDLCPDLDESFSMEIHCGCCTLASNCCVAVDVCSLQQ